MDPPKITFPLLFDLPLAAAAPKAAFGSCLSRRRDMLLQSCLFELPYYHLFQPGVASRLHPSEQYLECTETATASTALTVEVDDYGMFPEFRRPAASSSL